jgi:HK97 family phage portal protein
MTMGLIDSLERSQPRADVNWHPLDQRWYHPVATFSSTFSGFPIGPDTSKRVSAVFRCATLIAETLASLPTIIYRRLPEGGKEEAVGHRLYRTLLKQPNPWQNAVEFYANGQMHVGLRGNALAEIKNGGRQLIPMHPDLVDIEQLDSGRLRYQYSDPLLRGEKRTLLQDEVLHVRDLSDDDGISGQARVALAREAIAVAAAGEAFVGGFFKNDATGRLVFQQGTHLNRQKRKEFLDMIQENYAGWSNRAKAMLLTGGTEVKELGQRGDSDFIVDPRRFQVSDICRFWGVPSFMVNLEEKSTTWGTGLAEQFRGFYQLTMKVWADRWSQAMELALLTEAEQDEFSIEFDFADLLRTDLKTRFEAYQIGKQIGVWSPNEIRAKENEGPRDGGEEYQDNAPGAPPNVPTGTVPLEEEDEAEAHVPAPLLADVAHRIAERERINIERHKTQANTDPVNWRKWFVKFCDAHTEYVQRVLEPLASAYCPTWAERAPDLIVESLSAVDGDWETREREIGQILENTLKVAREVAAAA